jgi:hypothetical protein
VNPPRLLWSPTLAAQDPDDPTAGLIDASSPPQLYHLSGDRWLHLVAMPADAVPLTPATTGATP